MSFDVTAYRWVLLRTNSYITSKYLFPRALARNCAANRISEEGGDAGKNWREGKPVRVVRSYKMLKHFPKYAPKEGIRYDGIYKVVKYYPEKGLSGFRVWKYLLRRDDPSPAPWEAELNYPIIYPDGYLEAEAEKKALKEKSLKNTKGKTKKRALRESNHTTESEGELSPPVKKKKVQTKNENKLKKKSPTKTKEGNENKKMSSSPKKKKIVENTLSDEERAVIEEDTVNSKIWSELISIYESKGKTEFIKCVTQMFLCIICQEVTVNPITTPCLHNFCIGCIKQAFKLTGSRACPYCRQNLTKYEPEYNENLKKALQTILPGYDAGKK